jgi:hypothetical protein
MAFRKPPTVEVPKRDQAVSRGRDLSGVSIDSFAMDALDEVLSVGRLGILVDHPPQQTDAKGNVVPISVAAARSRGCGPSSRPIRPRASSTGSSAASRTPGC